MGRGRGRQVIAVAKSSDCILMVPCPANYLFVFLLTRCSGPRRHQERNPARASGKGIGDLRHKDQHSPPEHNIQEDFRGRRQVQHHCALDQVRRVSGEDHLPRVRSQQLKRLSMFLFDFVVFWFSVLRCVFVSFIRACSSQVPHTQRRRSVPRRCQCRPAHRRH
jgi:hypothetical protein